MFFSIPLIFNKTFQLAGDPGTRPGIAAVTVLKEFFDDVMGECGFSQEVAFNCVSI